MAKRRLGKRKVCAGRTKRTDPRTRAAITKTGKKAPSETELNRQRIIEAIEDERVGKFLIELAGPDTPRVLREIAVPASAESVAKNINMKVSGVRSILNKLHSHGIVEYTRVRDENTGWLSYVWNVKLGGVLELLNEKEKMMGLLQAQAGNSAMAMPENGTPGSVFFCAKGCGGKITFEEAFDLKFRCGSCGALLKSANGKA
ncbi:MAG: hypothetical protein QXG98_02700 [Candidatus Micrarchaeia archaeon]